MSLNLVDVAGHNFRTDEDSDKLNQAFMGRLGVKARLVPARLAIARSLATQGQPPSLPDGVDPGKSIKGDTLFGTGSDLSTWLALIIQKNGSTVSDLKSLSAVVGSHWRRGLTILDSEWEQCGKDEVQFIRRLVEVAGLPWGAGDSDPSEGNSPTLSAALRVLIGEISKDVATNEEIRWSMNGPGSSPHAAIMGGVGSGKTRTAVALLRSLSEAGQIPFIAFDFKGDLGTDAEGNGYHLEKLFGGKVIQPPRQSIPLNVLSVRNRDGDKFAIPEAALRFRDSFSNLKATKLGDKQKGNIADALERALKAHIPCELSHVRDEIKQLYSEKDMSDDSAISTIDEICRFPYFVPTMEPSEFFKSSWIISLPQSVPEIARSIIVNLVLDSLDSYLNSLPDSATIAGNRSLRIVCLIDEAHRILGTKLPALSSLIRMSRSKGGSVILISQSPDDFEKEEAEFLAEMGLVAAFSTNAKPTAVARIFGKGANLTKLSTGQCWMKLRGDGNAKRIIRWE